MIIKVESGKIVEKELEDYTIITIIILLRMVQYLYFYRMDTWYIPKIWKISRKKRSFNFLDKVAKHCSKEPLNYLKEKNIYI